MWSLMSKAIGGYVRRKDRHVTTAGLHYGRESHLGRLRHLVMSSGMVMSWRDEPLTFESVPPTLSYLPFKVDNADG